MFNKSYNEGYNDGFNNALEADADSMRSVKNELEAYRKKNRFNNKKFKYNIKIVYKDKNDNQFCDSLRKSLNQYGNVAFMKSYKDYKNNATQLVDYTIFYKNIDDLNLRLFKKIYDKAGCRIYIRDETIVIDHNEDIGMNYEELRDYYEQVIGTEISTSCENIELEKIKYDEEKPIDYIISNLIEKMFDKICLIKDCASRKNELFGRMIGIYMLPASIGVSLLLVPFGINEIVFRETLNSLENKKTSEKVQQEVQKQILLVKICKLFRDKQLGKKKIDLGR